VKGLTSTIVLAIVLAGLGGYIYFVEMKKPASDVAANEKAFTVDAENIEELRIKSADGQVTHLQKSSNQAWQVTEPVKADADPNEPTSIASGLSTLEILRVVDENPASLKDFGLDPPRIDVAFRAKGEKELRHLLLGEKTATGSDLYAMRQGDKRLFLVNGSVENTFNQGTFALRDKSVLKFDRNTVDAIEITEGPKTLAFAKAGDVEWNITKPVTLRGDFGAIDGMLNALASTQVQRFLDGETDLAKHGLDKPVMTATVSGGGTKTSLLIGKPDGGNRFGKDSSRPIIFTLGGNLMQDLQKNVADLRRKDLFDARPYSAQRFEFKRLPAGTPGAKPSGADIVVIEKAKGKDGTEVWKNAAGKELETEKAADPLNKFTNLRADSFENTVPAAAKTPELTIAVKFDEGKRTETISFARAGADVYAVRDGEPGAAKVPAAAYEDALKAIDNLK
jgi:hypothetical protein